MPSTSCSPLAFLQPIGEGSAKEAWRARQLRTGMIVGRWRVEGSPLGDSDDTVRYPVAHTGTGQRAVLAVYSMPDRGMRGCLARMRDVQNRIARIDDRGALAICDVGVLCDGHPYVVREAVDGVTLWDVVGNKRLSVRDAIDLVDAIVDVLIAAHAAGVVHGALSLDNVLIEDADDAGLKLLDWGMRAAIDGEDPATCFDDIYALGLVFDRLLPITRPPAISALVADMLGHRADTRPTIGEVARRLAHIDDDLTRTATARDLPANFPRVPRHLAWSAWRVAMFAVACIAPIFYVSIRLAETEGAPRSVASAASIKVVRVPELAPVPMPATAHAVVPAAAPVAAMPPQAAPAPMKTIKKRPPAPRVHAKAASEPTTDPDLLRRYQRVGRELLMLQRSNAAATAELSAHFRSINIHAAVANVRAQKDAAALLTNLERAIERNRRVEISEACRNAPLAAGCL